MDSYCPYTYLIGWSKQKKYYYGVRYASNCSPADLWVKYFTSSNKVKSLLSDYGNPDIKQVRKTFLLKEQAIKWETKVLKRMNVVLREDFLNENDAPAPPINNRIMSALTKAKISATHKGKPKSEGHKQKLREVRANQTNIGMRGKTHTKETIKKIKLARAKQVITLETRLKMSMAQKGDKHPNFGKTRSLEIRQKIKLARAKQVNTRKGKIMPVLTCPYCLKKGKAKMKKNHFENCIKFIGESK